jgi:gamma-glutamyltranspeptidase/glutathione hydrolase
LKNLTRTVLLLLAFPFYTLAAQQKSVVAEHGVVVSVDEYASKAGVEILKKGGNAVDAAVATAFTLAVTFPQAGNIGGGGFMLIRLANGESAVIDYREAAPAKATAAMFLKADGSVDSVSSNYGYLVAGVPGTVCGLETAWKKYGKLKWKELVEPAAELADRGFVVNHLLAKELKEFQNELRMFPASADIFLKKTGAPYAEGDTLVQKDLATTLRLIAEQGSKGFYEGETADKIAKDFKEHGGLITADDLKSYRSVIRKPILGNYRGYQIMAPSLPSSGGTILIEMLNILENYDFEKHSKADNSHVLLETMRTAFYDRARYLGDADFVDVPVEKLVSKAYGKKLFQEIRMNTVTPSNNLPEKVVPIKEKTETTHFSVGDQYGNMVSNTFTLQDLFGSKAVVRGLGFLLNDEMNDFDLNPKDTNSRAGVKPNLIQPKKRMLSSMTPTMVLHNGKPLFVTGSPGGRTIINTVLQIISNIVDGHMTLREAIDAPRINHNWIPDQATFERNRWDEYTLSELKRKGHRLVEKELIGDAHSIWKDPASGKYLGEADARRNGWAIGY